MFTKKDDPAHKPEPKAGVRHERNPSVGVPRFAQGEPVDALPAPPPSAEGVADEVSPDAPTPAPEGYSFGELQPPAGTAEQVKGLPEINQAPEDEDKPPPYDPNSATPHEHAVALGNLAPEYNGPSFGARRQRYTWQHESAAQLHGWRAHELGGYPEPFKLSQDDYKAALAAVEPPTPKKKGEAAPPMRAHEAAVFVPPSAPKGDG